MFSPLVGRINSSGIGSKVQKRKINFCITSWEYQIIQRDRDTGTGADSFREKWYRLKRKPPQVTFSHNLTHEGTSAGKIKCKLIMRTFRHRENSLLWLWWKKLVVLEIRGNLKNNLTQIIIFFKIHPIKYHYRAVKQNCTFENCPQVQICRLTPWSTNLSSKFGSVSLHIEYHTYTKLLALSDIRFFLKGWKRYIWNLINFTKTAVDWKPWWEKCTRLFWRKKSSSAETNQMNTQFMAVSVYKLSVAKNEMQNLTIE